MKFNEKLRETRKDLDIGQKELADLLKITQQQYSLYETGKRSMPADYLPALCQRLGVSSDYLLGLPKGLLWPR